MPRHFKKCRTLKNDLLNLKRRGHVAWSPTQEGAGKDNPKEKKIIIHKVRGGKGNTPTVRPRKGKKIHTASETVSYVSKKKKKKNNDQANSGKKPHARLKRSRASQLR